MTTASYKSQWHSMACGLCYINCYEGKAFTLYGGGGGGQGNHSGEPYSWSLMRSSLCSVFCNSRLEHRPCALRSLLPPTRYCDRERMALPERGAAFLQNRREFRAESSYRNGNGVGPLTTRTGTGFDAGFPTRIFSGK